jgi:cytochrome c-type biogenesis protein CcmH
MTLWLILALMTVAAIVAVVWPLVRHGVTTRSGSDVVVYRDQLEEVERDRAAGLIGKTEADAARVEISRRLLAAADAAKSAPQASAATPAAWRRWAVAVVSLLLLPAGAAGLYLRLGSPGLASEPLAARMEAPAGNKQQSIEKLVAQVEQHLQRNPKDGRGWEVLAPVYMQLGRYTASVNAWRNAIKLLGDNADREADLGEALTAEANGIVTNDAKAAFVRSVTLDSTTVTARYYLGLAAEQDGKREQAATIWRDLIAAAPPGAKWVSTVRTALARVEGKTAAPLPGPTPAQMLAAEQQPPAQQNASVRAMVERLAARLKKDGSDLNGWVQLVRSYKVMGQADKEKAAAADAKRALASDPDKLKQFEAALKDIESGKNPVVAEAPAGAVPPLPGPTPAQMLAASKQPPAQQDATIRAMVERLAERLKKDGSDVNGWVQLVRSYKVLGEPDKEKAAVDDAKRALANDPAKLKQFDAALAENGTGPVPAATAPTTGAGVAAPTAATPLPGPTPAQMLAAADKPAGQNDDMIRGMVKGLEQRLQKDSTDLKGWEMLVRSYKVLGDRAKEKAAIDSARRALAKDPDKLKQFDTALVELENNAGPPGAPPAPSGTTKQHEGQSIDAMVQGLAEKLKKSGDDPEGWLMLTRSYLTLKQNDKAMAAIKDARKALAGDPEKLQAFEAALKQFKIEAPQ